MPIVEQAIIPLNQLSIGVAQARTRDTGKNIDELANSIKKVGLLEPIVVAPTDDGNYEIVTGQRRFLAAQKLGWTEIPAGVLDKKPEEGIAKAISLTENMVREDMGQRDYIDACTELYKRYGSIKAVSEELGLPENKVSKYVKFEQLIPELKTKVDDGSIVMDVALKAQKAATKHGEIEADLAISLADEMKSLSGAQQKRMVKVATETDKASVEEIIEEGRKQSKVKSFTITISDEMDGALEEYAQEEGTNKGDAAATLIGAALVQKGYADSE